ncbi:hypothetical protein ACFYYH_25315 [Streptomyces sp. NPDC002018]|uniref:hypothetical protein n=1 Tax=Streptomyces sp. NPDC002018 TaxID=3364629 RepID=UPI003697DDE1
MTYDPKSDRSDTSGRTGRSDRTDRVGRTDGTDRRNGTDRMDGADRAGRTDRAGRMDGMDRTDGIDRTDMSDRTADGDRTHRSERTRRETDVMRQVPPPPPPPPAPTVPPARDGRGRAGTEQFAKAPHDVRESVKPLHSRPPQDTAQHDTAHEPVKPVLAGDGMETSGRPAADTAGGAARDGAATSGTRLLPQDESERLSLRLQDALSTFVDGPRRSVEEAAGVLDEAAERLTSALAERPRSLRAGWDGNGPGEGKHATDGSDTEKLRLALQSYREVTERLLRI